MPAPHRRHERDASPTVAASARCIWRRTAAALLLWVHAASLPVAAAPVVVVDDSGLAVTLPAPARRVVSLSPATTELLAAAGGTARLVGRTREANYPPSVLRLPEVGALGEVDVARVRSLKPDLLLLRAGSLDARTLAALRALHVPVLALNPRSAEGISRALKLLGRVVGTPKQAQEAQARFDAQWRALRVGAGPRQPLRVFVQLSAAPLLTPAAGGLLGESLAACGAVSVFAPAVPGAVPMAVSPTAAVAASKAAPRPSRADAAKGAAPAASGPAVAPASAEVAARAEVRLVTPAQVRQRAPQALVVVLARSPATPAGALELDIATTVWRATPALAAVRQRAVVPIAADEWLWPTPRWLGGTAQLCRALDVLRQPH